LRQLIARLAPSNFADPEKARIARLFYAILLTCSIALLIYGGSIFLVLGNHASVEIQTVCMMLMLIALVYTILRQGQVQTAVILALIGTALVLMLAAYSARGVLGVGFAAYALVTVCAGLLIGRKAALIAATGGTAGGGLILIHQMGDASHDQWIHLFASWIGESTIFFVAAFIVGFAVSRVAGRRVAERALAETEENYKMLVELSPDGVGVHQDGIFIFANQELARLLGGSTQSDIIGKKVMDLVAPDYRKVVADRIAAAVREGINVPLIEEELIRLDGKAVRVEVAASPVTFGGKKGVQVVVRDITSRSAREEILKESEEKWRMLAENVPDFITLVDSEFKILFINRVLPGWKLSEVIGRPIIDFHPSEEHSRVREYLTAVIRDGSSF